MAKIDLHKQINLVKPRLRPYNNPFTGLRKLNLENGNKCDSLYIGGKMNTYNSKRNLGLGLGLGLVGASLLLGSYVLGRGCRTEEPKEVKPENVKVFSVSKDYVGALVEPNGYFVSINDKGELFGVNINKEKTPFNFIEERKVDRKLKERSLETRLEVSGKPIVIAEPEEAPVTTFKVKKK